MPASVTIEAGSWMRVVNTNVTRTTAAAPIASARTKGLAPVSDRTRKWAAVMSVKITSATALPIEAIASRLKRTARTRHASAWNSSPDESRPPNFRAISGGNCRVSTSRSDSPGAGYSPALVAPAVANRAVTLISQ